MRILIADDEKLSRESLKSMLKDYEYPVEIIGEAENGEELVSTALKLQPEIVFADIRMPKMNGLDAINKIRHKLENTQWIILTGFSEFDYAKKAIQLEVSNYLLKPVDPTELFKTLDSMSTRFEHKLAERNTNFEKRMIDISMAISDVGPRLSDFENTSYTGIILHSDTFLDEKDSRKKKLLFYKYIGKAFQSLLDQNAEIGILPVTSSIAAAVVGYNMDEAEGYEEYKNHLLFKINNCISSLNDDDFVITAVKLEDYNSFSSILHEINQYKSNSCLRAVARIGEVFSINHFTEMSKNKEITSMSELLIQIKTYYDRGDFLNFSKKSNDFETVFFANDELSELYRSNIIKFLNVSVSCGIKPCDDCKTWHSKFNACSERLLTANANNNDHTDVIEQVKNYIEKNYMADICISEISDMLHMTPNYLSALFHKKTGMTFKKYLTNIRMLKAKQLLANSNCKVQQVAEEVGYYSTRYFTKIFKSYYNYYPSDLTSGKTAKIDS